MDETRQEENAAAEPAAAEQAQTVNKEKKVKFFTTRTMAVLAVLTAVGYGLSWLEFPLFPAAPFLKLDFSTFATLFGGYMFGPVGALVIEGIKQLIIWGTKSSTGGVG